MLNCHCHIMPDRTFWLSYHSSCVTCVVEWNGRLRCHYDACQMVEQCLRLPSLCTFLRLLLWRALSDNFGHFPKSTIWQACPLQHWLARCVEVRKLACIELFSQPLFFFILHRTDSITFCMCKQVKSCECLWGEKVCFVTPNSPIIVSCSHYDDRLFSPSLSVAVWNSSKQFFPQMWLTAVIQTWPLMLLSWQHTHCLD